MPEHRNKSKRRASSLAQRQDSSKALLRRTHSAEPLEHRIEPPQGDATNLESLLSTITGPISVFPLETLPQRIRNLQRFASVPHLYKSFSIRRLVVCRLVFGILLSLLFLIALIANMEIMSDHTSSYPFSVYQSYGGNRTNLLEGYDVEGPKHPVVMIPGIVSSGLELWRGRPCAESQVRKQFWGSTSMIQNMLLSPSCWIEHMVLDYDTGKDPEGIKLRSMNGLEAADYLIGGFWVWAKLIMELAVVGYDSNSQFMAAYDWRLSFDELEKRDHFFTKLKNLIEIAQVTNNNEKVVVVSHSWGSSLVMYFIQWVEDREEGWVDRHIHSTVLIGAPLLGLPKSVTSLLSGEMRDTVELPGPLDYLRKSFFSQRDVARIFRSWGSIAQMLPKGGDAIWGNLETAPDDDHNDPSLSYGRIISFTENKVQIDCDETLISEALESQFIEERLSDECISDVIASNYTSETSLNLLRKAAPRFMKRIDEIYSFGSLPKTFESNSRAWSNPLKTPLPNAPNMTIYSLYGVGLLSERAYYYRSASMPLLCTDFPFHIDTSIHNPQLNVTSGVLQTDGDGTVPLISMGFLPRRGWKDPSIGLNPYGVKLVTKEYLHEHPLGIVDHGMSVLRLKSDAADHVNIMGNTKMIKQVLMIAVGIQDDEDEVYSDIDDIVGRIQF